MTQSGFSHESLERDLQIARDIQRGFLPETLPQLEGWEIATCFEPARWVGGDFYDAFLLTQNRRVGVVIADVCDKGVGAALFMALFRTLIRAFATQHYALSWADVLTESPQPTQYRQALPSIGTGALKNAVTLTNNYIVNHHAASGMFATLFFGVIDPATGSMIYVNGGHNAPFITNGIQIKEQLKPSGPALGFLPNAEWEIRHTQIEAGETLLLYTYGVTEARDAHKAFYSDARLQKIIASCTSLSASEILRHIDADRKVFVGDAEQSDDVTLMAIQRLPKSQKL